ncbi:hypothetical protein F4778DRAFT_717355 [Xylariomycetidae sp. FL2044]|nr:hypothetical protein F4778DRAFT_717355 [Xylariomycetidae sp. FL2044]
MAALSNTSQFELSLQNSQSYPGNLIHRTVDAYPYALAVAEKRLGERAFKLFDDRKSQWEVPIRDICTSSGRAMKQDTLHTPEELREWLGVCPQAGAGITGTKRDPRCRFICLSAEHSRAKLELTREMFTDILSYHQVMPGFLDFVWAFG